MKNLKTYTITGIIFVSLLGTVLHFVYKWSGNNAPVGFFTPVNESIWEHIKLLIYPMFLFALAEYKVWGREVPCFWQVKLSGFLVGIILIPVIYYTYTGMLGVSADWFNITIFFIVAAAVYYLESILYKKRSCCHTPQKVAVAMLLLLPVVFLLLTFYPPRIPLFEDPVDHTYGYFQLQS